MVKYSGDFESSSQESIKVSYDQKNNESVKRRFFVQFAVQ